MVLLLCIWGNKFRGWRGRDILNGCVERHAFVNMHASAEQLLGTLLTSASTNTVLQHKHTKKTKCRLALLRVPSTYAMKYMNSWTLQRLYQMKQYRRHTYRSYLRGNVSVKWDDSIECFLWQEEVRVCAITVMCCCALLRVRNQILWSSILIVWLQRLTKTNM